jgi:hypothetical protein
VKSFFRVVFCKFRRKLCTGFCLLLLAPTFAVASVCPGDADLAARCPVEIGKAIDAADTVAFEKLVDTGAILNTALNTFLRDPEAMQATGNVPPLLALVFSRAATQDAAGERVRKILINEAKAFVLNGISSGAFAGRPPAGPAAGGLLAPIFADASTGRKEIREIGRPRPQGEEWIVPFVVYDAGNGETYPVLGRVTPMEGHFRLTAVENLDELVLRVNGERENQEE